MGEQVYIEAERDSHGQIVVRTKSGGVVLSWSTHGAKRLTIVPASELQRVPRRLPQTEEEWREAVGSRVEARSSVSASLSYWFVLEAVAPSLHLWLRSVDNNQYVTRLAHEVSAIEGWAPKEPEVEVAAPIAWTNWYEIGEYFGDMSPTRGAATAAAGSGARLCKVVVVDDPQETS